MEFPRTKCLVRALAALLFAATLTACQTTGSYISFDSADIPGGPIKRVSGLLFRPDRKDRRPAVILLHACGGLNSPHVREDWPNFLTSLGYVVFSVDSLGARGARNCTQLPGWGKSIQAVDAYHALDYLATMPFVDGRRIAVIGFSVGAIAINRDISFLRLRTGGTGDFRAAIALYGKCQPGMAKGLRFPVLEIVAEYDPKHGRECISIGNRGRFEVAVIEGAYHAFDQSRNQTMRFDAGGSRILYDSGAERKARALVKDFLARHLAGAG